LAKDTGFYDRKCLACHSSNGISTHLPVDATRAPNVCPTATANCVSCHMPKYDAPGMHAKFTDHFIRIVRPNELYPN
jgi:mono/diheme cytochrome c family protein